MTKDEINIVISDVCYGSKVMEYVEAGIPDSVSVFHPHAIYKSHLYFHCSGYVPLSSLCNQLGASRSISYYRHNFVVGVFANAVFRLRFIGQSSYAVYSRVKYEPAHKRYHIVSFFELDVQK